MFHKLRKQFREHRSQVGLDRQEKVFSSLPDRKPLQNLEGHEVIDLGYNIDQVREKIKRKKELEMQLGIGE